MLRIKLTDPTDRSRLRKWTPADMQAAYQMVQEGSSIYKAAKVHGVPTTTLRDRVAKRIPIECVRSGAGPVLSIEEEARFCQHLKDLDSVGYGYTRTEFIHLATDYAVSLGKRKAGQVFTIKWFYKFLKRWPELDIVRPSSLSEQRAKCTSEESVTNYIQELGRILLNNDLFDKPNNIYYIDEKGINIETKPQNVSGQQVEAQTVELESPNIVTVIGAGNAAGTQIPPFFVFPGETMVDPLMAGKLPGADGIMTPTGRSNSIVFKEYLQTHFSTHCQGRGTDNEPVLILYDGNNSHISVDLVDWAKSQNIILFVLPPHTSHILQPMDIGCFRPLAQQCAQECAKFASLNDTVVTKYDVCSLACKVYACALSPANLITSFGKAGIYPFKEAAVVIDELKKYTAEGKEAGAKKKKKVQDVEVRCNVIDVTDSCNAQDVTETWNAQDVTETWNAQDVKESCNAKDVTESCNAQDIEKSCNAFLVSNITKPADRSRLRKWSQVDMQAAYQMVQEGSSVCKAAKVHAVPITTLRDRVQKRIPMECVRSGQPPVLSIEEEARLCQHLKRLDYVGYGYIREEIMKLATDYAVSLGKRTVDQDFTIKWFYKFLKRTPELNIVRPANLSEQCVKCTNEKCVSNYFQELGRILQRYALFDKPHNIYFIDEKGINTEYDPSIIVCGKELKAVKSERPNIVTIIGAGNAAGTQIPPYFVFPATTIMDGLMEGKTTGADSIMTPPDWPHSEVQKAYLQTHFSKHCQGIKDKDPVLVLYDGHSCHISVDLVAWAKSQNIILFVLPPNTSHITQPIDAGCFGALEQRYAQECAQFASLNNRMVTKFDVCSLACEAQSCVLSSTNLQTSFEKAGIYPFQEAPILPDDDIPENSNMMIRQRKRKNPNSVVRGRPQGSDIEKRIKIEPDLS